MHAHLLSTELQLRWCAWWHFVTSCNGSLRTTISFVIDHRVYKRTFSAHSEWAATKNEWIKALKILSCARRQTRPIPLKTTPNGRKLSWQCSIFAPRGNEPCQLTAGVDGIDRDFLSRNARYPLGSSGPNQEGGFYDHNTAHNIMYLACGGRWIFAPVTRTGIDISHDRYHISEFRAPKWSEPGYNTKQIKTR